MVLERRSPTNLQLGRAMFRQTNFSRRPKKTSVYGGLLHGRLVYGRAVRNGSTTTPVIRNSNTHSRPPTIRVQINFCVGISV